MTHIHANFFATLLLATYPLFMLGLFLMYRPTVAVVVSFLASELLLPPLLTLPISPSWLTKWTLPPIAAFLCCLVFARREMRTTRAFRGVEFVFLLYLASEFVMFQTNQDRLVYGKTTLPGLTWKDFWGDFARFWVDPWICFFLGRALFKTSRDLHALLRITVVGLLFYSLLILFEMRMSPNLNLWVYGYSAGQFGMTMRWGGYRPTVFFKDGLPLAQFVAVCSMFAVAMGRARMRLKGVSMRTVAAYVVFLLVMCKSSGAIVYGLLTLPLILFASPKRAMLGATLLTLLFLAYPVLRLSDLLPLKSIVMQAGDVSAERAGSLAYRFVMEQGMLDATRERLWWGWGEWGRNFQYSDRGVQLSVPDGQVIIQLSSHGLIGFLTYFIPFAWAVLRAPKLIRKIQSRQDQFLLASLVMACAVILFDLILNSAFFPLFMLLYGALYSLPTGILAEERAAAEAEAYGAQIPVWERPDAQPSD